MAGPFIPSISRLAAARSGLLSRTAQRGPEPEPEPQWRPGAHWGLLATMSMAVETLGYFLGALGLLMLGVTLPHSQWRVSTIHGSVITTNTIFENLWYSCATDSLGVYNCREFPSMLALSGTGVWGTPGVGKGPLACMWPPCPLPLGPQGCQTIGSHACCSALGLLQEIVW